MNSLLKQTCNFNNKRIINTLITLILLPLTTLGQKLENDHETIYRRSSLYPFMIVETNRMYSDVIQNVFLKTPIPDKFNNHIVKERAIKNGILPELTKRRDKILSQEKNISNYLASKEVAKQLVAKWFNRQADGSFNMNLVAQRGSYNASEMDVELAKKSKRGKALLADAGEELIKNTFVIVNDFDYVNKEKVAEMVKSGLDVVSLVSDVARLNINTEAAKNAVTVFGKGYVVRTTSYLYRLNWNDSVAAVFYNDYWIDKNNLDSNRKAAFDNSDIFTMELIGIEVAWADLQSTVYTKLSEKELIAIATVRAMDAAIAKLQRKYEVFRTKTPLYSTNPLAAKIGLKEGLKKGDRFAVLEQVMTQSGRTKYKRRGVIKVDKNHIWDNRYEAGTGGDSTNVASRLGFTKFKGSDKYYKGMLIKQLN